MKKRSSSNGNKPSSRHIRKHRNIVIPTTTAFSFPRKDIKKLILAEQNNSESYQPSETTMQPNKTRTNSESYSANGKPKILGSEEEQEEGTCNTINTTDDHNTANSESKGDIVEDNNRAPQVVPAENPQQQQRTTAIPSAPTRHSPMPPTSTTTTATIATKPNHVAITATTPPKPHAEPERRNHDDDDEEGEGEENGNNDDDTSFASNSQNDNDSERDDKKGEKNKEEKHIKSEDKIRLPVESSHHSHPPVMVSPPPPPHTAATITTDTKKVTKKEDTPSPPTCAKEETSAAEKKEGETEDRAARKIQTTYRRHQTQQQQEQKGQQQVSTQVAGVQKARDEKATTPDVAVAPDAETLDEVVVEPPTIIVTEGSITTDQSIRRNSQSLNVSTKGEGRPQRSDNASSGGDDNVKKGGGEKVASNETNYGGEKEMKVDATNGEVKIKKERTGEAEAGGEQLAEEEGDETYVPREYVDVDAPITYILTAGFGVIDDNYVHNVEERAATKIQKAYRKSTATTKSTPSSPNKKGEEGTVGVNKKLEGNGQRLPATTASPSSPPSSASRTNTSATALPKQHEGTVQERGNDARTKEGSKKVITKTTKEDSEKVITKTTKEEADNAAGNNICRKGDEMSIKPNSAPTAAPNRNLEGDYNHDRNTNNANSCTSSAAANVTAATSGNGNRASSSSSPRRFGDGDLSPFDKLFGGIEVDDTNRGVGELHRDTFTYSHYTRRNQIRQRREKNRALPLLATNKSLPKVLRIQWIDELFEKMEASVRGGGKMGYGGNGNSRYAALLKRADAAVVNQDGEVSFIHKNNADDDNDDYGEYAANLSGISAARRHVDKANAMTATQQREAAALKFQASIDSLSRVSNNAQHIAHYMRKRYHLLIHNASSNTATQDRKQQNVASLGGDTIEEQSKKIVEWCLPIDVIKDVALSATTTRTAALSSLSLSLSSSKNNSRRPLAPLMKIIDIYRKGKSSGGVRGSGSSGTMAEGSFVANNTISVGVLSVCLGNLTEAIQSKRGEDNKLQIDHYQREHPLFYAKLFCDTLDKVMRLMESGDGEQQQQREECDADEDSSSLRISLSSSAIRNAFTMADASKQRLLDIETVLYLLAPSSSSSSAAIANASSLSGNDDSFLCYGAKRLLLDVSSSVSIEGERRDTSSSNNEPNAINFLRFQNAVKRVERKAEEAQRRRREEDKVAATRKSSSPTRRNANEVKPFGLQFAENVQNLFVHRMIQQFSRASSISSPRGRMAMALTRALDRDAVLMRKASKDLLEAIGTFEGDEVTDDVNGGKLAAQKSTAAVLEPSSSPSSSQRIIASPLPPPPSAAANNNNNAITMSPLAQKIAMRKGVGEGGERGTALTASPAYSSSSSPSFLPLPSTSLSASAPQKGSEAEEKVAAVVAGSPSPSLADALKTIAAFDTSHLLGPNTIPYSSYTLFSFALCFILAHQEVLGHRLPRLFYTVRRAIREAMTGKRREAGGSDRNQKKDERDDGDEEDENPLNFTATQNAFTLSVSMSPLKSTKKQQRGANNTNGTTASSMLNETLNSTTLNTTFNSYLAMTTMNQTLLAFGHPSGTSEDEKNSSNGANGALYDTVFECFAELLQSAAFKQLLHIQSVSSESSPSSTSAFQWLSMPPALIPVATFYASEKYIVPDVTIRSRNQPKNHQHNPNDINNSTTRGDHDASPLSSKGGSSSGQAMTSAQCQLLHLFLSSARAYINAIMNTATLMLSASSSSSSSSVAGRSGEDGDDEDGMVPSRRLGSMEAFELLTGLMRSVAALEEDEAEEELVGTKSNGNGDWNSHRNMTAATPFVPIKMFPPKTSPNMWRMLASLIPPMLDEKEGTHQGKLFNDDHCEGANAPNTSSSVTRPPMPPRTALGSASSPRKHSL